MQHSPLLFQLYLPSNFFGNKELEKEKEKDHCSKRKTKQQQVRSIHIRQSRQYPQDVFNTCRAEPASAAVATAYIHIHIHTHVISFRLSRSQRHRRRRQRLHRSPQQEVPRGVRKTLLHLGRDVPLRPVTGAAPLLHDRVLHRTHHVHAGRDQRADLGPGGEGVRAGEPGDGVGAVQGEDQWRCGSRWGQSVRNAQG